MLLSIYIWWTILIKFTNFRNFKLLSFGDEAEEEEEVVLEANKNLSKRGNSAHDIAQDPTLSSKTITAPDNSDTNVLDR